MSSSSFKTYFKLNKSVTPSNVFGAEKSLVVLKSNTTILPDFVGKHFLVYSGKSYKVVEIMSEMIGLKAGFLVYTKSIWEDSFSSKKRFPGKRQKKKGGRQRFVVSKKLSKKELDELSSK